MTTLSLYLDALQHSHLKHKHNYEKSHQNQGKIKKGSFNTPPPPSNFTVSEENAGF